MAGCELDELQHGQSMIVCVFFEYLSLIVPNSFLFIPHNL